MWQFIIPAAISAGSAIYGDYRLRRMNNPNSRLRDIARQRAEELRRRAELDYETGTLGNINAFGATKMAGNLANMYASNPTISNTAIQDTLAPDQSRLGLLRSQAIEHASDKRDRYKEQAHNILTQGEEAYNSWEQWRNQQRERNRMMGLAGVINPLAQYALRSTNVGVQTPNPSIAGINYGYRDYGPDDQSFEEYLLEQGDQELYDWYRGRNRVR